MAKPIYIWDTDTCIYWLKGKQSILDKTEQVNTASLYTTSISLAELKFGAYKSDQIQSNLKNVEYLARGLSVLPFNEDTSEHYGRIKARLSDAGSIIEDMDILIASIALANEEFESYISPPAEAPGATSDITVGKVPAPDRRV